MTHSSTLQISLECRRCSEGAFRVLPSRTLLEFTNHMTTLNERKFRQRTPDFSRPKSIVLACSWCLVEPTSRVSAEPCMTLPCPFLTTFVSVDELPSTAKPFNDRWVETYQSSTALVRGFYSDRGVPSHEFRWCIRQGDLRS